MDLDENDTPQKLSHKSYTYQLNKQKNSSVSPGHRSKTTPKNSRYFKKTINPRTPKGQSLSYAMAACSSLVSNNSSSLHSISMAVAQTPPAKRYQRIKNPFEAALAERLHLPLIASPSLFQRPNTPQMSSTQFEWTIDEVSSLKPANVEAHETQFQDSPDPELEAKAQSAISCYFKEQQIVPSPIDCPLRSQRIILSEINGNTPLSKPGRRIRDCAAQTELTLPPNLPPALEEALKPYFQPQLAGPDKELKIFGSSRSWFPKDEIKDISLRRKLFDMHNIVVLENENSISLQQQPGESGNNSFHSNSSPTSLNSMQHTAIVGKLSDSLDRSSFGSLSPISACDSLSPNFLGSSKSKARFGNFLEELEEIELLSPIHPLVRRKQLIENNKLSYRSEVSKNNSTTYNASRGENEDFTPEKSSSPLNDKNRNNIAEFSTDSFNIKVSRLKVNSSSSQSVIKEKVADIQNKSSTEVDIFDIDDNLESTVEMDEMQVLQTSTHSSNCSLSHSDTPRGKRRSASRKNLSQSFSASWLHDEEEEELDTSQSLKIKELLAKKQFIATGNVKSESSGSVVNNQMPLNTTPKKAATFYRTDSGFNEMSQNSSSSCEALKAQDIQQSGFQQQQQQDLMVCCSTPSKNNFNFI